MLLKNKKCPNCESYYDPTLKQCPKCHNRNELYAQRQVSDKIVFLHPAAQIGVFLIGFSYVGMLITEIIVSLAARNVDQANLKSALVFFFTYLLMFGGLLSVVFSTRRTTFVKKFTRGNDYLFGLAYAGGLYFTAILINIIVGFFYQGTNANQTAAVSLIQNYPILAGIVICLLGPICEEITYRVGLYSFLSRIDKVLAAVVTVFIFTLIHFDFTAENMMGELWSLPSYIACGAVLTVAYMHRGPACSMTAHIVYNSLAMVFILIGDIYG